MYIYIYISEWQSTVMAIMARLVRPGLHVPLLALPGQSHVCSGAKLFPVMLLKGARDGSNKMFFFWGGIELRITSCTMNQWTVTLSKVFTMDYINKLVTTETSDHRIEMSCLECIFPMDRCRQNFRSSNYNGCNGCTLDETAWLATISTFQKK